MTAWEWWLAFQRGAGLTEEEGRKALVSLAARLRRKYRLRQMGVEVGW